VPGIDLLSDAGFMQIDLIRYMRNHASAAHPNLGRLVGVFSGLSVGYGICP
jgi:hypothetical protein